MGAVGDGEPCSGPGRMLRWYWMPALLLGLELAARTRGNAADKGATVEARNVRVKRQRKNGSLPMMGRGSAFEVPFLMILSPTAIGVGGDDLGIWLPEDFLPASLSVCLLARQRRS